VETGGVDIMTPDKMMVTLGGIFAIAFIVWYFWMVKKKGVKAALTTSGYQEVMILVKGGYTPDVIVVEHGKPVRLNFRREESAACSEMVILGEFGKSAKLPTGETVAVEFLPDKPGEYEFTCQMGMFRGKLIVE
jgi:plastocyanin domain-containing protein